MEEQKYILSIDQGTSGTKAVLFDNNGAIISKGHAPLQSYFPKPGFVEQKPSEIYQNVLVAVKACLAENREAIPHIASCGISNQRETFLLWDKEGTPLCNAIVWQCKRSVDICTRLKGSPLEREIHNRTGLIVDPYFSGSKLLWLYENDEKVKKAVDEGEAYFGTIDTWLLYQLTGGTQYATDYTNASRTLFFNINSLEWDKHLLDEFKLSNLNLPEARPSSFTFGETSFNGLLSKKIAICSMIGDSHAAAFGEGCFDPGTAKATMGTGSSILMNTGEKKIDSATGMVTTICWSTKERVDYALEGIIVTCGATINWLKEQIGLFANSKDTEQMALSVEDNNGVYVIPAFSGLGAPHWKMDLKASIHGLTFGCDKNHIVRAALETIPYQIKDVISSMEQDSEISLSELKVDGGITSNNFILEFIANLLSVKIVNIGIEEVSALGAAYLAGLESGVFKDLDYLKKLSQNRKEVHPKKESFDVVQSYYLQWKGIIEGL